MARRQDHTTEQLRLLICAAAEKVISTNGLAALTARRLAQDIGYAPGTIYNFYADMDALVAAVNELTLQRLYAHCQDRVQRSRAGFPRVRRLAHAYLDFARSHEPTWRALFVATGTKSSNIPPAYQSRVEALFQLIEQTLRESLAMPKHEAARAGRLLWACLHGITALELDGRLALIGAGSGHELADDLLRKYLAPYL